MQTFNVRMNTDVNTASAVAFISHKSPATSSPRQLRCIANFICL